MLLRPWTCCIRLGYRRGVREPKDVLRLAALVAVAVLVVVMVQSLRHPARLWSPGLMGRVLAWSGQPTRTPDESTTGL